MSNNKCDHYADHDDYHNADDYNHSTNGVKAEILEAEECITHFRQEHGFS